MLAGSFFSNGDPVRESKDGLSALAGDTAERTKGNLFASEQKLAGQILGEIEAQNRALLKAIPDLMFLNRRDGEYLTAHVPSGVALLVPPEVFIGNKPHGVLPKPLADRLMTAIGRALDENALQELAYTLTLDGTEMCFEARVVPCTEDTVITIVRDVTERIQAEKEYRQLQAQLHHSQKLESIGILAGGVAHDMNNVLATILALSSVHLEIQKERESILKAFRTIAKAALRGRDTVKSLLAFSREGASDDRRLDVNAILRDEASLIVPTLRANVRLDLELEPHLHPVFGDASALTNVFLNLCVNAIDAIGMAGTLTLRTCNVDHDWIEIKIIDTGCGMSEDILAKAMNPFFTTKEEGKGTGLGLSLAYNTLAAHHGQMTIESEPGVGTSVGLRLPACVVESEVFSAHPEDLNTHESGEHRTLKVLLVDDDDQVRDTVLMLLEALGHAVTTASNGEDALTLLRTGLAPDVAILDMNMPGMGGAGTLPLLRALRPDLPVLLSTGRVDRDTLDMIGINRGVTILPKPFSFKELKKILGSVGAH